MKIYLAGPMSGLPNYNREVFNDAAKRLREAGHEVVNPAESTLPEGSEWGDYMREGLSQLPTCQGMALLSGWENSRGAILEWITAHNLGIEIRAVNGWAP